MGTSLTAAAGSDYHSLAGRCTCTPLRRKRRKGNKILQGKAGKRAAGQGHPHRPQFALLHLHTHPHLPHLALLCPPSASPSPISISTHHQTPGQRIPSPLASRLPSRLRAPAQQEQGGGIIRAARSESEQEGQAAFVASAQLQLLRLDWIGRKARQGGGGGGCRSDGEVFLFRCFTWVWPALPPEATNISSSISIYPALHEQREGGREGGGIAV